MKKLISLLILATFVWSCASERGVRVESFGGAQGVKLEEMSNTGADFGIGITISNTFKSKVQIKAAEFTVKNGGRILAKVDLRESLELSPSKTEYHTIPVRVRVGQSTFNELMKSLLRLQSVNIEGSVTAKKGAFQKKIKINQTVSGQEIERIIKSIGDSGIRGIE